MHAASSRILSTVLCCLWATSASAGKESAISLDSVPSLIRNTANSAMEGISFQSANTEKETNGTLVYELQGKLSDGRNIEVDIFSSGKIEEIEIEFISSQVPGAVLNAIAAKIPGFKPTYIEASHSVSLKVIKYEFEGLLGEQILDLEVSADGRKITIEDK